MDIEKIKEELSKSYLNAVCSRAGIDVECMTHDADSIDVHIKKEYTASNGEICISQMNIQLKATSQILREDDQTISFPLKVKNYNDLRKRCACPFLLCVLFLPNDETEWINHSTSELIIKRCMHWMNLVGMPDTSNKETVTLRIPKGNIVSPSTMEQLLSDTAEGLL